MLLIGYVQLDTRVDMRRHVSTETHAGYSCTYCTEQGKEGQRTNLEEAKSRKTKITRSIFTWRMGLMYMQQMITSSEKKVV